MKIQMSGRKSRAPLFLPVLMAATLSGASELSTADSNTRSNSNKLLWSQPDPRISFSSPFQLIKVATKRPNETIGRAIAAARLAQPSLERPPLSLQSNFRDSLNLNHQQHQPPILANNQRNLDLQRSDVAHNFGGNTVSVLKYLPFLVGGPLQARHEFDQEREASSETNQLQLADEMQSFGEQPSQVTQAPLYQLAGVAGSPAAAALAKHLGPAFALMPIGYAARLPTEWPSIQPKAPSLASIQGNQLQQQASSSGSPLSAASSISSYASKLMAMLRPSAPSGSANRDQWAPPNASLPGQLILLASAPNYQALEEDLLVHQATSRVRAAPLWPEAPICMQAPSRPGNKVQQQLESSWQNEELDSERNNLDQVQQTSWSIGKSTKQHLGPRRAPIRVKSASSKQANRKKAPKAKQESNLKASGSQVDQIRQAKSVMPDEQLQSAKSGYLFDEFEEQQVDVTSESSASSQLANSDASNRKSVDKSQFEQSLEQNSNEKKSSPSSKLKRLSETNELLPVLGSSERKTGGNSERLSMIPFTINDKIEYHSSTGSQLRPLGNQLEAPIRATLRPPVQQPANLRVQFDEPIEQQQQQQGPTSDDVKARQPSSIADLKSRPSKTSFLSTAKISSKEQAKQKATSEHPQTGGQKLLGSKRIEYRNEQQALKRDTHSYSFPMLMASSKATNESRIVASATRPAQWKQSDELVELVVDQDRAEVGAEASSSGAAFGPKETQPPPSATTTTSALSMAASASFPVSARATAGNETRVGASRAEPQFEHASERRLEQQEASNSSAFLEDGSLDEALSRLSESEEARTLGVMIELQNARSSLSLPAQLESISMLQPEVARKFNSEQANRQPHSF